MCVLGLALNTLVSYGYLWVPIPASHVLVNFLYPCPLPFLGLFVISTFWSPRFPSPYFPIFLCCVLVRSSPRVHCQPLPLYPWMSHLSLTFPIPKLNVQHGHLPPLTVSPDLGVLPLTPIVDCGELLWHIQFKFKANVHVRNANNQLNRMGMPGRWQFGCVVNCSSIMLESEVFI